MPRYSAFLSYSSDDAELVHEVQTSFEENDLTIWLDRKRLKGADLWQEVIRRGLTQSDVVVVLVTKNLIGSYAEEEIRNAVDMRKRILPLIFDDTINSDNELARTLRKYQYHDMRKDRVSGMRDTIQSVKRYYLAPVVSIYNIKGGVGKTTITMNLGAYFYKKDQKRILLVDFDPQANLSTALIRPKIQKSNTFFQKSRTTEKIDILGSLRDTGKSIVGVLEKGMAIADKYEVDFDITQYIHQLEDGGEAQRFDIVAGDPKLSQLATSSMPKDVGKAIQGFERFIGQCREQYDCILIDMNPSISTLSKCALAAATHVLSPVKPDSFTLQGLDLLDDIALENDAADKGREQIVLINDPKQDMHGVVRERILNSKYKNDLIDPELVSSRHFYANPGHSINSKLNWLPAYGVWGPAPNKARQSLRRVAGAISERIGLVT